MNSINRVCLRDFGSSVIGWYCKEVNPISVIYRTVSGYMHRKIADTDVLVSVGAGIADFNGYIELNASAAYLWDQLKEGCTSEDLQSAVQREFGIDAKTAESDVDDFLALLKEHKMLVEV